MFYICNMDYHKDVERISKSGLDLINKSPLHYYDRYYNRIKEEKKTPALLMGSAIHTKVLEPDEYGKVYAVAPEVDRRTKAGKADWDAFVSDHPEHEILTQEQDLLISNIHDAVYKHEQASVLLKRLISVEQVFTHEDKKCKPDGITMQDIMIDLKTTEDASPRGFGRSAYKYRYDVQAAWYMDILREKGHTIEGFVFIAVEKSPPFAVACYVIEDEDVEIGRQKYQENYNTWKECKESGNWPGFGISKLQLPNYGK